MDVIGNNDRKRKKTPLSFPTSWIRSETNLQHTESDWPFDINICVQQLLLWKLVFTFIFKHGVNVDTQTLLLFFG